MSVPRIKIGQNEIIVYKLGDEEFFTKKNQEYDMIGIYITQLFAKNIVKREMTIHPRLKQRLIERDEIYKRRKVIS